MNVTLKILKVDRRCSISRTNVWLTNLKTISKPSNSVESYPSPPAIRMLSSHLSSSSSCFLLFSNSSTSLHKSGFSTSIAMVFRIVRPFIPKSCRCSNSANNALTFLMCCSLSWATRFFRLQIKMSRCSSLDSSSAWLICSSNCLYSFLFISNRSNIRRRSHFLIPFSSSFSTLRRSILKRFFSSSLLSKVITLVISSAEPSGIKRP